MEWTKYFLILFLVCLVLCYDCPPINQKDKPSVYDVPFGIEQAAEICPCGTAVAQYILQIDPYHGIYEDDMFITGIKFRCNDDSEISSASSNRTKWNVAGWSNCKGNSYPVGIQLIYEALRHTDIGATAGIRLICSNGRSISNYNGFIDGTWPMIDLPEQICSNGYALVGLKTQVDEISIDKSGLNNVIIYCEPEHSFRCYSK